MTSVLPVLALHTWPEKADAMDGWTGWTYLSRRRVALLAGVHKDTVTAAFRRLVDIGLMVMERRPRRKYEGGYKTYYALTTFLYPQRDEAYAEIPANLFYGGTWFMLPSPACRHLYIVLACLDPIGDEDAYLTRIEDAIEGEWDQFAECLDEDVEDDEARAGVIRAKLLAKRRASGPLSLSELQQYRPKTNTRVTSRKLTRRGCGRHQCQIGFPISCGCNRHEINARHIHRTAPHRLQPI